MYSFTKNKRRTFGVFVTALIIAVAFVLALPSFLISAFAEIDINPYSRYFMSVTTFAGADETEMNFTWMASALNTESEQYLEIVEHDGEIPDEFPSEYDDVVATAYNAKLTNFRYYRATMTGLKADTRYIYRVGDGYNYSAIYSFKTVSGGDTFNFVALGDAQLGTNGNVENDLPSWTETLSTATNSFSPSFIMHLGDEVESWDGNAIQIPQSETEYQVFYGTEYTSSVPFANVIGNHEVSKANWSDHHNNPNQTKFGWSSSGGDQAADYWFVAGNALFLVLNSNVYSDADTFFEKAISAAEEKYGDRITWKIVSMHHTLFGVNRIITEEASQKRQKELAPILKKHDVDLVLMAHEHTYCRTHIMGGEDGLTPVPAENGANSVIAPDGILYMTLGSSSGNKCFRANIADKTTSGEPVVSGTPAEDVVVGTEEQVKAAAPYVAFYNEAGGTIEKGTNHGVKGVAQLSNISIRRGKLTISTYVRGETTPFDEFTLYKSQADTVEPPVEPDDGDDDKNDKDGGCGSSAQSALPIVAAGLLLASACAFVRRVDKA